MQESVKAGYIYKQQIPTGTVSHKAITKLESMHSEEIDKIMGMNWYNFYSMNFTPSADSVNA